MRNSQQMMMSRPVEVAVAPKNVSILSSLLRITATVRLDLFRRKIVRQLFFVLSKSQLDSPSHFTSNLSPEAVENLKQELSSTKVTLHLDYQQSFFFLGPSSKTRETRK